MIYFRYGKEKIVICLLAFSILVNGCMPIFAGQIEYLHFSPYETQQKGPVSITMEEGAKYDLSAVVTMESKKSVVRMDQVSKETYRSSNTGIVSISKTGLLKAKKTGSSVVTVTYSGKKLKLNVKVVSPVYADSTYAKALNKSLATFAKGINGKDSITKKNRLTKLKQLVRVREAEDAFNASVSEKEFFYNGFVNETLVTPKYASFKEADQAFYEYALSLNPMMKESNDTLSAKSVTATPEKVMIKLDQKVTSDMVFGQLYRNLSGLKVSDIGKGNRAPITAQITKKNIGADYELRGELIRGKDTIILVPYVKDGATHQWSKTTLPEGEWKFWDEDMEPWIYGMTFDVK